MTQSEAQALSLLGLCRKAGKLSHGHDLCVDAVRKGRARLCLLCEDSAPRIFKEFQREIDYKQEKVKLIRVGYKKTDFQKALSVRAGVVTVDDDGFAERVITILGENEW
jgi:ribosomal protein L7Ae-like RNA K-turn-binding protein